jgi:hypothetical protein
MSGQAEPLYIAILSLGIVLIPLIGFAVFARRQWRKKLD